ncbi:MAG: amidase family protein [Planctomycetota bacterium]
MPVASDAPLLADLTATELGGRLQAGELSSAEVVEACIKRVEATAEINALVQPRFDEARAEARECDGRRASGAPLGPLHGVPISIKDCFAVAGMATTLGIPGYSKGPDAADSPLVARLRAAGAIVLGKTNVPQAMLLHECDNPVFGRTTAAGFADRSPGGSTGGEAALVAAGGSVLGLGSDLGGSIRQPAAACGVCGFKPSPGRLTIEGSQRAISSGMQAIGIQPGPMARSVADLDLAMRVLADPAFGGRRPGESSAPWRDYRQVDLAKLRVACWADDGVFKPAVGVARAIADAAQALRAVGAEVIELPGEGDSAQAMLDMVRVYIGLVSADAMASVRRLTRGGRVEPQLARQMRLARLPRWGRSALQPLLRGLGQRELAELLAWSGARSADEYWQLTTDADAFRRRFWPDLDRRVGGRVDAVLSPPYGLPALRHGTALHLLRAASHSFLANLLGVPAGVVPVGFVTAEEEQAEVAARKAAGRSLTHHYARQNAERSTGLPLAVEVLGRPGEDHVAMAAMAAIEAARA